MIYFTFSRCGIMEPEGDIFYPSMFICLDADVSSGTERARYPLIQSVQNFRLTQTGSIICIHTFSKWQHDISVSVLLGV